MRIDGACHCGFIAYEAEVDPDETSICHCIDCQTLSGSPFRVSVSADPGSFRLLHGEPAIYVKTADSGTRRAQAFCPKCGSPIYATAADDSDAGCNIRVGTIRQRDRLVPTKQIWMSSAQPWIEAIGSIHGTKKE